MERIAESLGLLDLQALTAKRLAMWNDFKARFYADDIEGKKMKDTTDAPNTISSMFGPMSTNEHGVVQRRRDGVRDYADEPSNSNGFPTK